MIHQILLKKTNLVSLMLIGPRKCLILSTFGAIFQLSIALQKNSLTRYPLMGLKNYDISLLLKKSQSNSPMCLENTAVGT